MYYVCRAGKKRNPSCPQRPIACLDLDRSLRERLERMRGALPDAVAIQQLLQSVRYDSVTRRVSVELRDGSRFEYLLPLPVRAGVRQSEQRVGGRTPHVSRLVALAIKFQSLVSSGTVRNYRELAELGHVSRPRLSQIMKLAQLAPEIQEKLLFLPPTLEGPDRVFERHLRFLASLVVRSLTECGTTGERWHFSGRGGPRRPDRSQTEFQQIRKNIDRNMSWGVNNNLGQVMDLAATVLEARLESDPKTAISNWRKAVGIQDRLTYFEPPAWYYPVPESLGAALLKSGDAAGADELVGLCCF